jgi:hypothetical protein
MKVLDTSKLLDIHNGRYPVYLTDMRAKYPQVSLSEGLDDSKLAPYQYALVREIEPPEGHVVIEGFPVHDPVQQIYKQVWHAFPPGSGQYQAALDKAKDALYAKIRDVRTSTAAKGRLYEFPDGQQLHVQMRDEDKTNVLGLRITADDLLAQGINEAVLEFRTYEDINIPVTPEQMRELASWYFQNITALMQASWEMVNQVKQAQTFETLPEIPESF